MDGFTGFGSRTAYFEQIEAHVNGETGISQLGIVFLDVNNLKKVNDNQGHDKGDEFCVMMTGESLEEKYEAVMAADSAIYANKRFLKSKVV
ncbi:MAG: diguanylate cyclase [Lachnospiraceae bacterium]|nr:diguanylate cyclase [Lachnospiraceae bacterium]